MRLIVTSLFIALLVGVGLTAMPARAADSPLLAAGGDPAAVIIAYSVLRVLILSGLIFSLIAAFKIPGTGLPETLAVFLLAALLVPAILSGTGQWYEVAAILGGIGLLAVEAFIIPGVGAAGIAGALLVFGGILMLFVPTLSLPLTDHVSEMRNALLVMIGGILGGVAAIAWLGRYLPNIPRANRLILGQAPLAPMPGAATPAIGQQALALTDLMPGGTARVPVAAEAVGYRDVPVVSDRGYIPAGSAITIIHVQGALLTVRKTHAASDTSEVA